MKCGESPLIIILDGMMFYVIRINKNTFFNIGKIVISDYLFPFVIPVKAGIQCFQYVLDTGLRRRDSVGNVLRGANKKWT